MLKTSFNYVLSRKEPTEMFLICRKFLIDCNHLNEKELLYIHIEKKRKLGLFFFS